MLFRNIRSDECRESMALVAKDPAGHMSLQGHVISGTRTRNSQFISATKSLAVIYDRNEGNRIVAIDERLAGNQFHDISNGVRGWCSRANFYAHDSQEVVYERDICAKAVRLLWTEEDVKHQNDPLSREDMQMLTALQIWLYGPKNPSALSGMADKFRCHFLESGLHLSDGRDSAAKEIAADKEKLKDALDNYGKTQFRSFTPDDIIRCKKVYGAVSRMILELEKLNAMVL